MNVFESGTIEITPEMAETIVKGLLETVAFLAPNTFNAPKEERITMLKQPAYVVLQRWCPKLDLLKYLPEIVLATGILTTLKEMKKTEIKK